ncbi:hypothetical protein GALL_500210 [mine drainage metagenome]|uniref:Uncharacterized protein n=1 Tax=mine drainage metagenome TaxID=410659 RepID=A0A1J5PLD7_9ZZZZ
MMPLCTSASTPLDSIGCALCVAGAPCVAQRVWQMPVAAVSPAACARRSATRCVVRRRRIAPPSSTASPHES